MEPIIKEKETVYVDGYNGRYGGGENLRGKANAGLTLGIIGAAGAGLALARQGGVFGIGGGGAAPANVMTYYNQASTAAPCPTTHTGALVLKECDDILNLTKGMFELHIASMNDAERRREVDVSEKFGLFINNRNSIDALRDKTNAEFFSLYKYTRDKDDETRDRIAALEVKVAKAEAIRPYQDQLILCKINDVAKDAAFDLWKRTCRMITGQLVLPNEPTITGFSVDRYCNHGGNGAAV